MIEYVIKADGTKEPFTASKLNKWAEYAGGNWAEISLEVYRRLPSVVTSKEIHKTMTNVCADKKNIEYSRVASRLEIARIRKNMERIVGVSDQQSFKEIMEAYIEKGYWDKNSLPPYNEKWEEVYAQNKSVFKEYWELVQWGDKYSINVKKEPIETPHVALLASALALHGDNEIAYKMYKYAIEGKLSLPTPALNGFRNGDFDSISCSLISSNDTTDSILVASYLAAKMTAKKAGIGLKYNVRSIKDPVRNGAIEHLGKHTIFAHASTGVKIFKQLSRGGSATTFVDCIDPEILNIFTWKSQRSAIDIRLDKIDYALNYNNAFYDAWTKNEDWYLFSSYHAPEIYKLFFGKGVTVEQYKEAVKEHIERGVPHKKVKAREITSEFLKTRSETGRFFSLDVTRANDHTPFLDPITQSNLCLEILQPTKGYVNMEDLVCGDDSVGEISFCGLSASNYSKIDYTNEAEIEDVALVGIYTVNRMIEKAPMPHKSMKTKLLSRRNVGYGITGLADAVYKNGMDYKDDKDFYEFVRDIAEKHTFYAYKASQKYAEEFNLETPKGIDINWLPIDTAMNILNIPYKMDWESIRGKTRANSVLVSVQPSESSSVFSGGLNAIYPARSKWIEKVSRHGNIPQIFINYDENKHVSFYDLEHKVMCTVYSIVGDMCDQAISADYAQNPDNYPNRKKPLSEFHIEFARHGKYGVKTMYYQNTKVKSSNQTQESDCPDCAM